MGFGDIGATITRLVELGISEALAGELRAFLNLSAGELTENTPETVAHSAYGRTPGSVQLCTDATKARTHVADALKDMAAGLEQYGVIVTDLYRDVRDADDTAEVAFKQKAVRTDACFPGSFAAAPTSCGAPGASGQDG